MSIILDRSSTSIVVWCTECPTYSTQVFSTEFAYDEACAHESQCHDGETDASKRRSIFLARRARNVEVS